MLTHAAQTRYDKQGRCRAPKRLHKVKFQEELMDECHGAIDSKETTRFFEQIRAIFRGQSVEDVVPGCEEVKAVKRNGSTRESGSDVLKHQGGLKETE